MLEELLEISEIRDAVAADLGFYPDPPQDDPSVEAGIMNGTACPTVEEPPFEVANPPKPEGEPCKFYLEEQKRKMCSALDSWNRRANIEGAIRRLRCFSCRILSQRHKRVIQCPRCILTERNQNKCEVSDGYCE